jgi:hypothetical protein
VAHPAKHRASQGFRWSKVFEKGMRFQPVELASSCFFFLGIFRVVSP